MNKNNDKLQIRNSTAEFMIFTAQAGEDSVEVRYENKTIWLTQKMIALLFGCSVDNVSLHLKNIFKDGELDEHSVVEKFSVTASDGKQYSTKHYNLDAEHMGFTTWEKAPHGKILRKDDVLDNSSKVTAEIAKAFAESEFEKYRIVQDRLFESDFDKLLKESGESNKLI